QVRGYTSPRRSRPDMSGPWDGNLSDEECNVRCMHRKVDIRKETVTVRVPPRELQLNTRFRGHSLCSVGGRSASAAQLTLANQSTGHDAAPPPATGAAMWCRSVKRDSLNGKIKQQKFQQ